MFNTIIISGRLTATPELKTTQNGKAVCKFTIANETGYGEYKQTSFVNCTAWGKIAEFICNYFDRGQMIGLQGELHIHRYNDKNGNERTSAEINVQQVQFMDKKSVDTVKQTEQAKADNIDADFTDMDISDGDLPF